YRYGENEFSHLPLDGFPVDKIEQVCPTDVVSPDGAGGLPKVRSEGCIMCGVCVARCPVGAIFIDPLKGAVVQVTTNNRFIEVPPGQDEEVTRTRFAFSSVERDGIMIQESDSVVKTISMRSDRVVRTNVRYPTLLTRNLLRALGASAAAGRVGVSSMRMELLHKTVDGHRGVVEAEFGDEAGLDVPRQILDDVAVLVARHDWALGEFQTAVVLDVLPNRRSDFWRIIGDIRKVTRVNVLTISLLSLMLAVWRQKKLTRKMCEQFYTDEQTESYLMDVMTKALGFKPRLASDSSRWVNWIK
ncbi:MAG TPA: 4Fe-4S binding protein, partial [Candidatus Dormibacteraeota bacterium]|nr:4Fe-4S binding protein [Candidatus Dormibacteraeota bacterium]